MQVRHTILRFGRFRWSGQFWSVGLPTKLKILWICSISLLPGRRGAFRMSSPMMQPTLHMSMAVEYSFTPAKAFAPEAQLQA